MRIARRNRPKKWGNLPELEIVDRLLHTDATYRSVAKEYGCSPATIRAISQRHTTRTQRAEVGRIKANRSKRGIPNLRMKNNNIWTGRKHRPESLEKISKSKTGCRVSMQSRIARSAKMQGIPLAEWEGFASPESARITSSAEWRAWRSAVYKRDQWTCQRCKRIGGKLNPHHILSRRERPDLIFCISNGETLCVECHRKTESYGRPSREKTTTPRSGCCPSSA